MSAPIVAFYHNYTKAGKTTLTYHIAWCLAALHQRVLVVDFDPNIGLTNLMLGGQDLGNRAYYQGSASTVFGALRPCNEPDDYIDVNKTILLQSVDLPENYEGKIKVAPGDACVDELGSAFADAWHTLVRAVRPESWNIGGFKMRANPPDTESIGHASKTMSAPYQLMTGSAFAMDADIVLVDMSHQLSDINRAVILSLDHLIVPMQNELKAVRSLPEMATTLDDWREKWNTIREWWGDPDMPEGKINPIGYTLQDPPTRYDERYKAEICDVYTHYVRNLTHISEVDHTESSLPKAVPASDLMGDPDFLGGLRYTPTLYEMAEKHRCPVYRLPLMNTAINSVDRATLDHIHNQYKSIAYKIIKMIGLTL